MLARQFATLTAVFLLAIFLYGRVSGQSPISPPPEDLVLVQDDTPRLEPGCDKISVYDLKIRKTIHRGAPDDTIVSTGRMAGNSDLTQVLAVNTDGRFEKPAYLAYLTRDSVQSVDWRTRRLEGGQFTESGDIAVLPDNDTFVVAEGSNLWEDRIDNPSIAKYRLSDIEAGRIGPRIGHVALDMYAARILVSPDGHTLHVIEATPSEMPTHLNRVRSFDSNSLAEVGVPIDIPTINPEQVGFGVIHGSISLDGRYMVTNNWMQGYDTLAELPRSLIVVDLVRRTWRRVDIGRNRDDMPTVGGVSFNYGAQNRGLLAVHAATSIVLFRIGPAGELAEIRRVAVPGLDLRDPFYSKSAPWMALNWSGTGDTIIAAGNSREVPSDFVFVDVRRNGRDMVSSGNMDACLSPDRPSMPLDILTTNGRTVGVPDPTPTPTLPTTTPPPHCVCREVQLRVPPVVVNAALANPEDFEGWLKPLNPGIPPGPNNPVRSCLSLRSVNVDYHPLTNSPIWRAGCP